MLEVGYVEAEIREAKDFLSEIDKQLITKNKKCEERRYMNPDYIRRDTAEMLLFPSMMFMGMVVGGLYGLSGMFTHLFGICICSCWWLHPIAFIVGIGYCLIVSMKLYNNNE